MVHEQEVRDLFLANSVEFNESQPDYRVISFDLFSKCISEMMEKAFHFGKIEGLTRAAEVISY